MADEDVAAVVRIHRDAFRTFFLSQLGPGFLSVYYSEFVARTDTVAHVAERNGTIIGFVVGAVDPRGFYRRMLRDRWWRFAAAAIPAVLRDPRRARRVARGVSHPGANPAGRSVAGLFSIAVSSATQRTGAGQLLVRTFVDDARARGCREVYLTTDADDNAAGNTFYRTCGFEVRGSFRTPEGRVLNEYWNVI